ncbi:non-hydrolyzing UDP-N-acetylglucosamine 2-epimerase [Vibrio vulnificus]|uniref:non-hydrolyzing UDP-N-acetylglucosamine 2-epimerase n=1 Tax=Vibrio vulnificus TaxID=672 RepID=UPI001A2EA232|nr:UDP-N-acetylglucosamine 2-epimerase (non-hydrolyzing) [Vibrio vulnificus]
MKVLTVVGARPQFIKAATVSRVIEKTPQVKEVLVHTGQHFDINMSDVFFEEMAIPKPDYSLNISSLSHGAMTGRMLESLEEIIIKEKPNWVLVYGDTNSTLAGALAASKLNVKVAHVEAGLRSYNMRMPEEQNRIIVDRLSSILFCPTKSSISNLVNEGYSEHNNIVEIGDVMYDASQYYKEQSKPVKGVSFENGGFILATIHRAENTDNIDRLSSIVKALNKMHKKIPVVLPLHPRTKKIIAKHGLELKVNVIEPIGYLEMIHLLKHCFIVASDSGGVQKEAYFFNKHCLVLRDETEWTELVDLGANKIVGADFDKIINAMDYFIDNENKEVFGQGLYGDGRSAEAIVEVLLRNSEM